MTPSPHPRRFGLVRTVALAGLLATIPLGVAAQEPAASPAEPAADLAQRLEEIEQLVGDAYFRTALALVASTRERLAQQPAAPALAAGRARLELLGATAEIAFGHRDAALACMRRALALDPDLALDPRWTSPRLLELAVAVRAEGS